MRKDQCCTTKIGKMVYCIVLWLYTCTPSVGAVFVTSLGCVHHTCRRLIDKNRCMCVRVDVVGQAATWLYVPQNIESKLYSVAVTSTFADHSSLMVSDVKYVSFYY